MTLGSYYSGTQYVEPLNCANALYVALFCYRGTVRAQHHPIHLYF